jgi:hypothetical protein
MALQLLFAGGGSRTEAKRFSIVVEKGRRMRDLREKGEGKY